MKKIFTLFIVLFFLMSAIAQKNKADSLGALLAVEKQDSNRVTLLWNMANVSYIYNPDTAMLLSQQALNLAQKIKFTDGESRALGIIANTFLKIGNYSRALEFYLQKLKIEEKRDNSRSLASVVMNIGIVYVYQEEYRKALYYLFKADSVITANNIEDLKCNIGLNLGDVYNRLNINDSAFIYFEKSLGLAIRQQDGDFTGASMVGLGHSYFKQEDYALAMQNYLDAMPYLQAADDEDLFCEAAIGLAELYEKLNRTESAEYYARKTLSIAKKDGFLSWQQEAASFLKDHFKKLKKNDSALAYTEQAQSLKDSISSKERIRESQILSSNEQLRQSQLAESKQKAKEERFKQLQFLFIGIFIPILFLFTLFLSRRRVHIKVVKSMGIISLLILFEFLTLLLHPYVLEMTNHMPVFEIMIFVSIAAVLIPSHHRLENWLIEKLTHKRNGYTDGRIILRTIKLKKKKPSN